MDDWDDGIGYDEPVDDEGDPYCGTDVSDPEFWDEPPESMEPIEDDVVQEDYRRTVDELNGLYPHPDFSDELEEVIELRTDIGDEALDVQHD